MDNEEVKKRNDTYAALTIGEALTLVESRRGESKKEKERLMKLLEKSGVTKRMTIAEARGK